ncbi:MAG: trigger factor, partial [Clostridia bacterium]|nr:trigger factor [Clostridia bacterium]
EYKGLKVEKASVEVTEDEIQNELNRLAERNARVITADRAAQNGDIAVIDFEGFVDGVAFQGGKGEGHDLTLGSGQFIPGFEDQIVGHVAGDEFDVNVTFPAEYHADELAGKEAVFKTKLNEVKVRELPAMDDDFAKDVSEFDTLDELKNDIKEKTAKRKENAADNQIESDLLEQLVASLEGEIPEVMYEQKIDESLRDFDYRLRMQGMSLNDYVKYTGGDITAMRDSFREQAEKQVKMRLALEKVAQLEGITASDEDVAAEIKRLAEMYNVSEEQVKASVPTSEIAKDLVVGKAVDVIKAAAVITEKKAAKKSTAKKTAAKKAEDAE